MLVKVFSLKFDSLLGEFDDGPLRSFVQDKEIIQINDHLIVRNEIPYLVLILKYYPYRKEADSDPKNKDGGSKENQSWKSFLTDADLPLFNQLRDWRSERCKKDGLPPYLIFNNIQLAQIAKSRPQSIAELEKIEGIGKGKTEKYAEEVLKMTVREEKSA